MRNVELKAIDPEPERTLAAALALDGVRDEGVLVQRDTYFRVGSGRLKLREEQGRPAHLIAYARPDEAEVRISEYSIVEVPDPSTMRAALAGTAGVLVTVAKRRRLLLWRDVRIHLDEVDGLGRFLELEAVVPPGAGDDLGAEEAKVAGLRGALDIRDEALREGSYSDALLAVTPDAALEELAREAAANAYAPYSGLRIGAAVRDASGRRYAGANVENAAYPQGQCAEASALGAMVAGGGGPVAEVVVAAATGALVTPCGGCRQRLREFTPPDAPVDLVDGERVRRTTSLAELLPLAFGPEALA